jgi:hypothetical protein
MVQTVISKDCLLLSSHEPKDMFNEELARNVMLVGNLLEEGIGIARNARFTSVGIVEYSCR